MSESSTNLNPKILASLLREIESELRDIDLWTDEQPRASDLTSTTPFCHDTLPFQEWVQWVMIPTFDNMLSARHPLPTQSQISPMAEIAFADMPEKTDQLIKLIQQLDDLLNSKPQTDKNSIEQNYA